jgi:hypothetical protein
MLNYVLGVHYRAQSVRYRAQKHLMQYVMLVAAGSYEYEPHCKRRRQRLLLNLD